MSLVDNVVPPSSLWIHQTTDSLCVWSQGNHRHHGNKPKGRIRNAEKEVGSGVKCNVAFYGWTKSTTYMFHETTQTRLFNSAILQYHCPQYPTSYILWAKTPIDPCAPSKGIIDGSILSSMGSVILGIGNWSRHMSIRTQLRASVAAPSVGQVDQIIIGQQELF